MARATGATALLTAVGVFAAWTGAFAAEPTQADFDVCNREAQAAIQSPAASPGASGGASGSVSGGTGSGF